jgi:hypothetical protein
VVFGRVATELGVADATHTIGRLVTLLFENSCASERPSTSHMRRSIGICGRTRPRCHSQSVFFGTPSMRANAVAFPPPIVVMPLWSVSTRASSAAPTSVGVVATSSPIIAALQTDRADATSLCFGVSICPSHDPQCEHWPGRACDINHGCVRKQDKFGQD